MSTWVVDAGPLIFLAKLNRLSLIQTAGKEIYIPAAAMSEIRVKSDAASSKIEEAARTWLQVKKVENQDAVSLLLADLDIGEAEVIVLANEIKADILLMDDLDARRFARRVGLSIVGTLGVLLAARLRGEISSVAGEIKQLQRHGFWVSDALTAEILKAAGEG